MTRDELERAISACGFWCLECGSDQVRLDHAPLLGYVPVIVHARLDDGEWCPALSGGPAAVLASLDLLDALLAVLAPYGGHSYGDPVWHRRERLAA